MANINLRPWREERRKERQQQFVLVLLLVAVASSAGVFSWMQHVTGEISTQKARIAFLQDQIKVQDEQIKEIKTLKEERTKLVERMRAIQRLQGDRPVIVRIFDEMVRTLPEGVYYHTVKAEKGKLTIYGVADKTNGISDLLRYFDESEWFKDAFLIQVNALKDEDGEQYASEFEMTVMQTSPRESEQEEGEEEV